MVHFGVHPNLRNSTNETLLHRYFGRYVTYNQDFVNVLSEHRDFPMGAVTAPGQRTILHAAVLHRMPATEAIRYLLDCPKGVISINDADADGKTPLMSYLCPFDHTHDVISGMGWGIHGLNGQHRRKRRKCWCQNTKSGSDDQSLFMRDAKSSILDLMTGKKYGLKAEVRDRNGNCIVHYACKNPMMSEDHIEEIMILYLDAVSKKLLNGEESKSSSVEHYMKVSVKEFKKCQIDMFRREYGVSRLQRATTKEALTQVRDRQLTGKEQIALFKQRASGLLAKWDYELDDVDVKNRFHQTPFMFYLGFNQRVSSSMINVFLDNYRSDPMIRDGVRNGIFHWAVRNTAISQGYGLDALRFLCETIEDHERAFEANAKGESILHSYFSLNKAFSEDVVRCLRDYKVDLHAVDLKGNTCLHAACGNTYVRDKMLLFLMSEMDDEGRSVVIHIEIKNKDQLTPLELYRDCRSEQEYLNFIEQVSQHPKLSQFVKLDRVNNKLSLSNPF